MYHEENNHVYLPANVNDEHLMRRPVGYERPIGFGAPFVGGLLGGLLGSALIRPYGYYGYGYPPYNPYYGYGYGYGYGYPPYPYYPYY